jgi:hypothetical protein
MLEYKSGGLKTAALLFGAAVISLGVVLVAALAGA